MLPDYRTYQGTTMLIPTDQLYHHGILGMHWGIRRFQPYPKEYHGDGRYIGEREIKKYNNLTKNRKPLEERKVLSKGTIMYRTTANENEKNQSGKSIYVTYLQPDRNLYKGGYIRGNSGAKQVYEKTYQLRDDVKIAGKRDIDDAIKRVNEKNSEILKKGASEINRLMIENFTEYSVYEEFGEKMMNSGREVDYNNKKTKAEFEAFKKEYVDKINNQYIKRLSEDVPLDFYKGKIKQSFGINEQVKNLVIEDLKRSGFNGMTDEAGVGIDTKEGLDPLILFDSSVLNNTKTESITGEMEQKSRIDYYRWQGKARSKQGNW